MAKASKAFKKIENNVFTSGDIKRYNPSKKPETRVVIKGANSSYTRQTKPQTPKKQFTPQPRNFKQQDTKPNYHVELHKLFKTAITTKMVFKVFIRDERFKLPNFVILVKKNIEGKDPEYYLEDAGIKLDFNKLSELNRIIGFKNYPDGNVKFMLFGENAEIVAEPYVSKTIVSNSFQDVVDTIKTFNLTINGIHSK